MTTPDVRWTDEVLDAFRLVGDPPADRAVDAVFAAGQIAEVNRLMRTLVRNDMPPPGELPAALQDYFETTDNLPEWADLDAIARSQEFFARHGLLAILILGCYSLPVCYAAARGVKVIYDSARLYSDARRRVVETAQLLVDGLAPGGLAPDGAGVRSTQKVRLMHAAVRSLLLKRGWDTPTLGIPINQEDLVGTLGTFSFYFMDGLRRLNVRFLPRDADDYIHTWNVIGHILGIQRALLPQNFDEATYLAGRISERHFTASPEGKALQEALTGFMQSVLPGSKLDGLPVAMTRHFLGRKRADLLDLPPADWTQLSLIPFLVFNVFLSNANLRIPPVADTVSLFSRKMIENLLVMERGGERTDFHIPQSLKDAWKIS
jgi:hypothetical protein